MIQKNGAQYIILKFFSVISLTFQKIFIFSFVLKSIINKSHNKINIYSKFVTSFLNHIACLQMVLMLKLPLGKDRKFLVSAVQVAVGVAEVAV